MLYKFINFFFDVQAGHETSEHEMVELSASFGNLQTYFPGTTEHEVSINQENPIEVTVEGLLYYFLINCLCL